MRKASSQAHVIACLPDATWLFASMKTSSVFLAAMLILMTSLSPGQSVVLSNTNPPRTGLTLREEIVIKLEKGTFSLSVGKQSLDGSTNAMINDIFERVVVSADQQKVTVKESSRNIRFSIGTQSEPKDVAGHLLGKNLVGKKANGHWTFLLADKQKADAVETTALKQFAGYTEFTEVLGQIFGPNPHHVGETWKPDLRALKKSTLPLDADLECKFEEVIEHNDERCAHITVKGHFIGTLDNGGNLNISIDGNIYRSLRDLIDIDTDFTGTFKYSGAFGKGANGQPGSKAEIEAPLKLTRTVKIGRQ
jgi:hypothetical protein